MIHTKMKEEKVRLIFLFHFYDLGDCGITVELIVCSLDTNAESFRKCRKSYDLSVFTRPTIC